MFSFVFENIFLKLNKTENLIKNKHIISCCTSIFYSTFNFLNISFCSFITFLKTFRSADSAVLKPIIVETRINLHPKKIFIMF